MSDDSEHDFADALRSAMGHVQIIDTSKEGIIFVDTSGNPKTITLPAGVALDLDKTPTTEPQKDVYGWSYIDTKSDDKPWNRDNPVDNMKYIVQPRDLPKLAKVMCFCCDKEIKVFHASNYRSKQQVELFLSCHGQTETKYFDYDKWEKLCKYGTWQAFL